MHGVYAPTVLLAGRVNSVLGTAAARHREGGWRGRAWAHQGVSFKAPSAGSHVDRVAAALVRRRLAARGLGWRLLVAP